MTEFRWVVVPMFDANRPIVPYGHAWMVLQTRRGNGSPLYYIDPSDSMTEWVDVPIAGS